MSDAACRSRIDLCGDVKREENSVPSLIIRIFGSVISYIQHRRSVKRNLEYLHSMDDHLLQDIGLRRETLRQTVLRQDRTP
ncbi:DUF1127 domain-containing protein [Novispirillum itersonii]|uniref:DUF1127 domain-containing protein n=1 Tax=Novispirillum itersonii TaxID=189 RepID=UPI001C86DB89|nr:hypothetical protein [Novispirillum itersonii]